MCLYNFEAVPLVILWVSPPPLRVNYFANACSASGGGAVSIAEGMESIQMAVDLMNNNQYREAVRLLKPQCV